jgi:hypothetical protein
MTQRNDARLAGYAYLLYIVFAMSSSLLFARAVAGEDTAHRLSSLARMVWTARLTVLLDLYQTVCALVLATTLYSLVKTVNPTLARLALLFRVGEGLLAALPTLSKLELMQLVANRSNSSANAATDLSLASELLHRPDSGFSEFCFVVGGFLFAWLFLRGQLIPRPLAWIGVITIGAQLICVPLHIAMMVPGSVENALWLPILLYEVPLGIYLIAKGTRPLD